MIKAKEIKQMQLDDLESTFQDVQDLVLFSATKVDAVSENNIRLGLRKQNIILKLVKNTFARRVFEKIGIHMEGVWDGPTMVAWGGTSLAGLSKALEKAFKDHKAVEFKAALADRQQVSFKEALEMPTKEEAIGEVVMLMLSPIRRVAGQITAPAATLAGQLKAIEEKDGEENAA